MDELFRSMVGQMFGDAMKETLKEQGLCMSTLRRFLEAHENGVMIAHMSAAGIRPTSPQIQDVAKAMAHDYERAIGHFVTCQCRDIPAEEVMAKIGRMIKVVSEDYNIPVPYQVKDGVLCFSDEYQIKRDQYHPKRDSLADEH